MEEPHQRQDGVGRKEFLGLRVQIHTRSGTSGKITLDYSSLDQFDGIVKRLRRED